MIIKDMMDDLFFSQSIFYLTAFGDGQIKLISNGRDEETIIFCKPIHASKAMDYIYKCYKRDDRCCDLNDLIKDKTK